MAYRELYSAGAALGAAAVLCFNVGDNRVKVL